MTMTNLVIVAGLILALACFAYVYFGARKLARQHELRLSGGAAPSGAAVPAAAPARAADPEVAATPAAAETPAASPFVEAPDGAADDLLRIKGIGPKLSARLTELGVYHYAQIAGWTPEQLAIVDAQLGSFQGRPQRDQWQSQAALLAAGDLKAYERVHGKLGPAA